MKSVRELLLYLIITIIMATVEGQRKDARIVCYYANWSVYYNTKYKFTPKDIEPQLCTHLVYAFGTFTNETALTPFDKFQDIDKGGYLEFTGRKRLNSDLKTMISIGGWNEGSSRFSAIASDESRRKLFTKNTIEFLRQHDFDGLDIDWQYPGSRDGSRTEDRENYVKFIQTMHEEFAKESVSIGRSRLLLSITVPLKIEFILTGFDIENLNRYVDWMNVVSYNYHTAYESTVNHHSPLYSHDGTNLNVNFTIGYYIDAGADPQKLNLGIPAFGHSYTLMNPDLTDIGSLSEGPGLPGEATEEEGYLAYFEICQNFLPKTASDAPTVKDDDEYEDEGEKWVIQKPSNIMGPYAYKGNQWLCYDDIEIVKRKAEFAAEKFLGGIMFWSIDNDDYLGRCHGEAYPIIKAAKTAFYSSLGIIETESITLVTPENNGIQSTSSMFASFRNSINQNENIASTTTLPSTSVSEVNANTPNPHTESVSLTSPSPSETERAITSSGTTIPISTENVTPSVSRPSVDIYTPIIFPITSTAKPNVGEIIPMTPIVHAVKNNIEPINALNKPKTSTISIKPKHINENKDNNNDSSSTKPSKVDDKLIKSKENNIKDLNAKTPSQSDSFETSLSKNISDFLKQFYKSISEKSSDKKKENPGNDCATKSILITQPAEQSSDDNEHNKNIKNGIHIQNVYISNLHLKVYN